MEKFLEGKHILITGASAGIGEATAIFCADKGAKLLLCDISESQLEHVASYIEKSTGTMPQVLCKDLSQKSHVSELGDYIKTNFSELNVVINNAGVMVGASPLEKFEDTDFEDLINNNIFSTFYVTRELLPILHKREKGGLFLYTGSVSGIIGQPTEAPYAGTKAFMHAFMQTISVEQAANGIRANAVAPGPIDTQMTRPDHGTLDEDSADMILSANPMGRRGTPYEIASVFGFLASDMASYINGEVITVDGGFVNATGNVGEQASDKLKNNKYSPFDMSHQHDGWNAGNNPST